MGNVNEKVNQIDIAPMDRLTMKGFEQKSLHDLPDEMIEEVMSFVTLGDLLNLSKVNTRLEKCAIRVSMKHSNTECLKNEWITSARIGNLEKMKNIYTIMKEKGNEEDIKDWRGSFDYTILLEATLSGSSNILRWLLHELKFDVNEQNKHGETALHLAATRNQMECARLLLDAGSLNLKNQRGITPLDWANSQGHTEMQRLIESHFQLSSYTPLDIAKAERHAEMQRLIESNFQLS